VLTRDQAAARAAALTEIGRQIFNDQSLSASGQESCASCHDPSAEFGPPNSLPVQRGGGDLMSWGTRAVPNLRYMQAIPPFTLSDVDTQDYVDGGAAGGLTWDGRVDQGKDQARIPLLSPIEMANADPAAVVAKARAAPYAAQLEQVLGADVFDDPERGLEAIGNALEAYEEDPQEFYPYTSKFDAYFLGKAKLTPQEQRGLALFNDPDKGNCASCHPSSPGNVGGIPAFSDFRMFALGVPRNSDIPANADPKYFDMGVCGPARSDLKDHPDLCGLFRTPSLRNVATRGSFFHNGEFHDLKTVVTFYATRDTDPGRWYPTANGAVETYNDLPASYHTNVYDGPPFGLMSGDKPRLTDAEIDDIVAFLQTLTDGYVLTP
jgi:cytochrome c peroxidase